VALETFTWSPRVGAVGTFDDRTRTAKFGDGFAQSVGDGLNSQSQGWPLQFTGREAYIVPIRDFLRRHGKAKAFLWTPPLGELGLYKQATEFTLTAAGGGIYTLSASFEQAFHP